MHLTLHVWRQQNAAAQGKMVRYEAEDINPEMSFLEMLDVVNWRLIEKGEEPIAFDHAETEIIASAPVCVDLVKLVCRE